MSAPDNTSRYDDPPHHDEQVRTGGWSPDTGKVHARAFPGPASADEALRIHFTRSAYAAIIAHAKESLSAEICGVMVGDLCEDERGLFVDVKDAIRGATNKSGGTHVTYTQETWDEIYKVKERDFPKLRIVGWYHSHPGFGVEFSDMDMFIQQNFFAGVGQFALVVDPLGGEEAICANVGGEVVSLKRFWVDGRERRLSGKAAAEGQAPAAVDTAEIAKLEQRISQLMLSTEQQQVGNARLVTFLGMLVAAVFIVWIGMNIYNTLFDRQLPPKQIGTVGPILIPDADGGTLGFVGVKAYWSAISEKQTQLYFENLLDEQLKSPQFRRHVLDKIEAIEAGEQADAEPPKGDADADHAKPDPSKPSPSNDANAADAKGVKP